MITSKEIVLQKLGDAKPLFAVVKNPAYVFPPEEYYQLANANPRVAQLKAALMDMDGTTTTTEELCIYSLETMVRRMGNVRTREQWQGLDHHADYPNIIGNSTTKHVEYLLKTYAHLLHEDETKREFIRAAAWTIAHGQDPNRREEVIQNTRKLALQGFVERVQEGASDEQLLAAFFPQMGPLHFDMLVALAIDIYYEEYHRILLRLSQGEAAAVKLQVFGDAKANKNLISPMPGIGVIVPLIKGWLGADIAYLLPELWALYPNTFSAEEKTRIEARLLELSLAFEQQPAKLALVTSSIRYEANIVVTELYRVLSEQVAQSALPVARKTLLREKYANYRQVYDAFITASDSSEIRLKPHRDLYSIALHQVGLRPEDFDKAIGFEDSQSGTVAIRAAGVGCCIAVPFAQTAGHNLEAATYIAHGGIPEVLLGQGLFIG